MAETILWLCEWWHHEWVYHFYILHPSIYFNSLEIIFFICSSLLHTFCWTFLFLKGTITHWNGEVRVGGTVTLGVLRRPQNRSKQATCITLPLVTQLTWTKCLVNMQHVISSISLPLSFILPSFCFNPLLFNACCYRAKAREGKCCGRWGKFFGGDSSFVQGGIGFILFNFFIVFETAASQNPLAFSVFDKCRLLSCTLEFRWSIWQGDEQVFYTDGSDWNFSITALALLCSHSYHMGKPQFNSYQITSLWVEF